jgi:hypothetical protein
MPKQNTFLEIIPQSLPALLQQSTAPSRTFAAIQPWVAQEESSALGSWLSPARPTSFLIAFATMPSKFYGFFTGLDGGPKTCEPPSVAVHSGARDMVETESGGVPAGGFVASAYLMSNPVAMAVE